MSQQTPIYENKPYNSNFHYNRRLFLYNGFEYIEIANNTGKDTLDNETGRIVETYSPPSPSVSANELKIINSRSTFQFNTKESYVVKFRLYFYSKVLYREFKTNIQNKFKYYSEDGNIYLGVVRDVPEVSVYEGGSKYFVTFSLVLIKKSEEYENFQFRFNDMEDADAPDKNTIRFYFESQEDPVNPIYPLYEDMFGYFHVQFENEDIVNTLEQDIVNIYIEREGLISPDAVLYGIMSGSSYILPENSLSEVLNAEMGIVFSEIDKNGNLMPDQSSEYHFSYYINTDGNGYYIDINTNVNSSTTPDGNTYPGNISITRTPVNIDDVEPLGMVLLSITNLYAPKHWSYDYVQRMASLGLITQIDNAGNYVYQFRPEGMCTRSEFVAFLNRTRKYLEGVLNI